MKINDVEKLQRRLVNAGYLDKSHITGYYDMDTKKAYMKHQRNNNVTPTGEFETETFKNEQKEISNNDGKLYSSELYNLNSRGVAKNINNDKDTMEDCNTFFNDNKTNMLRQGNVEIGITYANSKRQKKKITGVKFRSVSQVIDSSGEPIAEVFEFVGKDLKEG